MCKRYVFAGPANYVFASVNKATISSDNGLTPNRHQTAIWTNADLLPIGPSSTHFSKVMMTSSNGIFCALLAICAGNSPVTGEFPSQRPVTQSFDVFLDLRLDTRLSKQWWGWWFETPSRSLWRHCNVYLSFNVLTRNKTCNTYMKVSNPTARATST